MKLMVKILALMSAAMLALASGQAIGQAYPSKPVRLVVAYPPGGGTDNLARMIAPKLSERLGQPVIIENKPGAAGQIGVSYVAKAQPDGYTLLVGTDSEMMWNVGLYDKLPYDPVKDFAPISRLSSNPLIFAVNPSVPAKSLQDLIAMAKAQPGKLFYSEGAPVFRVAGELFKQRAGVKIGHVPYKGTAPAVTAAVAGEVQMVSSSIGPLLGNLSAGKLRGLAITSAKRNPLTPEIPTMAEAGIPDFVVVPWTGLFAPAGTPSEIVERINKEVAVVLAQDDVKGRMAKLGVELGGMPAAEFAAMHRADVAKWPKIVRDLGISAQ